MFCCFGFPLRKQSNLLKPRPEFVTWDSHTSLTYLQLNIYLMYCKLHKSFKNVEVKRPAVKKGTVSLDQLCSKLLKIRNWGKYFNKSCCNTKNKEGKGLSDTKIWEETEVKYSIIVFVNTKIIRVKLHLNILITGLPFYQDTTLHFTIPRYCFYTLHYQDITLHIIIPRYNPYTFK